MRYLSIGEFAERTRLSPKALRLYDESGLLVPARVDDRSGYRYYGEDQVDRARLVASLRRLDVPLATVATIVDLSPADAAMAIAQWWDTVEARTAERRELAAYLQASLRGEVHNVYDIQTRQMPARTIATINRRVDLAGIDAFFHESFGRLRGLGPGIEGIAGCPYLVFYGEVSEDSDGPVELARPSLTRPPPRSPVRPESTGSTSQHTTRSSSDSRPAICLGPPCSLHTRRWARGLQPAVARPQLTSVRS